MARVPSELTTVTRQPEKRLGHAVEVKYSKTPEMGESIATSLCDRTPALESPTPNDDGAEEILKDAALRSPGIGKESTTCGASQDEHGMPSFPQHQDKLQSFQYGEVEPVSDSQDSSSGVLARNLRNLEQQYSRIRKTQDIMSCDIELIWKTLRRLERRIQEGRGLQKQ